VVISPNIKAVLFDFDGTLINTMPLLRAIFAEELTRMRIPVTEELEHAVRETLYGLFTSARSRLIVVPKAMWVVGRESGMGRITATNFIVKCMRRLSQIYTQAPLFPDVIESLERLLKWNIHLGIVTSGSPDMVEPALKRFGIAPLFEVVITRADVRRVKPHPEGVLQACEDLGVAPSNVVVIGDLPFDILAGNAAGCWTVAVRSSLIPRNDVIRAQPSLYCQSIREAVDWIEQVLVQHAVP
jgi:HAD superfamily hydrolase (TIGR01509 family)